MKLSLSLSSVVMSCVALSAIDAFRVPGPTYEFNKPIKVISESRGFLSNLLDVNLMEQKPVGNPKFCHSLDCPAYKVLSKTENYEVREYEASRWVTTEKMNMGYDEASHIMFMRLFEYIEGNNDKKEKIKMTAPVITRVIPGQGPACKNNFTMSFFMAPIVKDPPTPKDKTVSLSEMKKQKVFVSSFPGIEHEKDWISHARKLAESLKNDKQKFDSDIFYTAGYDSPFRLLFRHNEIWFMAK